jgi:hypothetical protein
MDESQSLSAMLKGFADSARCISGFSAAEYPIPKIRSEDSWPWAGGVGVYYFKNSSGMLYIGRALPGTKLGARVSSHLQPGNDTWDTSISQDDAILGIIRVPDDQWYFAASLELYLMDGLNPPFNKKRG